MALIAPSASSTAITSASHAVSSVFMPSRIAGSFSMQTIREPLIGVFDSGVVLVTAAVWLTAAATGTVTENAEPPLTLAEIAMRWLSTRASRSTIDSPRPRPRAMRAPCSSRWNSLKISPRFCTGMPTPVS